jgi:protein SCO1/2
MAVLVAFLSATSGAALWKLSQARQQPRWTSLIVLPEPRVIADFALIDYEESPFSLADLRGHWSLVFFGFTHCPDVCPTALYELQQVKNSLSEKMEEDTKAPQFLFVSVDPERDTAEILKQFLTYFDPAFIGVTGKHEQLLPLTRQVGIAYRIEDHEMGASDYGVDHSTGILLVNPQGRLHGVFPAPHLSENMVADLAEVMNSDEVL